MQAKWIKLDPGGYLRMYIQHKHFFIKKTYKIVKEIVMEEVKGESGPPWMIAL